MEVNNQLDLLDLDKKKTLNPTLINKITSLDYLGLYVEQPIPWAKWVEANNHNR